MYTCVYIYIYIYIHIYTRNFRDGQMGVRPTGVIEECLLTLFNVSALRGGRDSAMHVSIAPVCFIPI